MMAVLSKRELLVLLAAIPILVVIVLICVKAPGPRRITVRIDDDSKKVDMSSIKLAPAQNPGTSNPQNPNDQSIQVKRPKDPQQNDPVFSLGEAFKESKKVTERFYDDLAELLKKHTPQAVPNPGDWNKTKKIPETDNIKVIIKWLDRNTQRVTDRKDRGRVVLSVCGIPLQTHDDTPDYASLTHLLYIMNKARSDGKDNAFHVTIEIGEWIIYKEVLKALSACVNAGVTKIDYELPLYPR
ncbi:MAG: hypothetical protein ABIH42_00015 [Planctomycetota bacterium]